MNFNSNFFWCIIGIIGSAIVSFIISFVFYLIGLKRKKLTYNIKTFCIISDKINQIKGLEVKYNANEIENLFSSTITIKNIGNSNIEKEDFALSCPLSISTNGKFLVDQSNGINLFNINEANNVYPLFEVDDKDNTCNRIIFAFNYIPKKDILTCSLFHTGEISFNGILKDGKIIDNKVYDKLLKVSNFINKVNLLIVFGLVVALITLYFSK